MSNNFTFEHFTKYFDRDTKEVARIFSMSREEFRDVYRNAGIEMWPYRMYNRLTKKNPNLSSNEVLKIVMEKVQNEIEEKKKFEIERKLQYLSQTSVIPLFNDTITKNELVDMICPSIMSGDTGNL